MDLTSDLHMHTTYSDGSDSPETMAAAALEKGLRRIAITDHMPLPHKTRFTMGMDRVEQYREEIRRIRTAFAGRMEILLGIEMEISAGGEDWTRMLAELGWDWKIGSVHIMEKEGSQFMVNGTEAEFMRALSLFGGDARALCAHYFTCLREAAGSGLFDAVGHLDVIRKHNQGKRFFDDESPWFRDMVADILDLAAHRGLSVEVNTGGFDHPVAQGYPREWIMDTCRGRGIPLVMGSDAHTPLQIARYFSRYSPNA